MTFNLKIRTTPAFANAARRLFTERHKGALFRLSDNFVYTSEIKSIDVGFSYMTPTFHKTDFDPYNPPENMKMVWELRPPPLESGFIPVPVPAKSMKCSDGKYHFEVPENSMIARLQPSDINLDIEYELDVKRAEENYKYTQLRCSYGYDAEPASDDAPIDINFNIKVINNALDAKTYLANIVLDIYVYLQEMRIFFENYKKVVSIIVSEVENSVEISVENMTHTLVSILLSQAQKIIDYDAISFTTYQVHIMDHTVKLKFDRIIDPKTDKPKIPKRNASEIIDPNSTSTIAWNKIVLNMLSSFAEEFKRVFDFTSATANRKQKINRKK